MGESMSQILRELTLLMIMSSILMNKSTTLHRLSEGIQILQLLDTELVQRRESTLSLAKALFSQQTGLTLT